MLPFGLRCLLHTITSKVCCGQVLKLLMDYPGGAQQQPQLTARALSEWLRTLLAH
jgi:hypothetical protein